MFSPNSLHLESRPRRHPSRRSPHQGRWRPPSVSWRWRWEHLKLTTIIITFKSLSIIYYLLLWIIIIYYILISTIIILYIYIYIYYIYYNAGETCAAPNVFHALVPWPDKLHRQSFSLWGHQVNQEHDHQEASDSAQKGVQQLPRIHVDFLEKCLLMCCWNGSTNIELNFWTWIVFYKQCVYINNIIQ